MVKDLHTNFDSKIAIFLLNNRLPSEKSSVSLQFKQPI